VIIKKMTKGGYIVLRLEITNHLGPNPRKGGSPPKDKRTEKKIII
jgi:hypothetical protein